MLPFRAFALTGRMLEAVTCKGAASLFSEIIGFSSREVFGADGVFGDVPDGDRVVKYNLKARKLKDDGSVRGDDTAGLDVMG
ncbi:MAG: hypothetical protein ABUJ98_10625 [Hyphomicrobium sp.]